MRERVNEQELRTSMLGSMNSLFQVVDGIQDILERAYGLQALKLRRVSQHLWPRKDSPVLRHNFEIGDATGTNFSTDWDIPTGAWKKDVSLGTDYYRQFNRERWLIRLNPRRIIQGRFHFQDLHPVLYVSPELAEKTQGVTSLDQMLTDQRVESLELITMGVSNFLNAHTQYLLHQEMPRPITAYGMALVDFYHVVRDSGKAGENIIDIGSSASRDRTGRFELIRTLFARQGLEAAASEIALEGLKEGKVYYNPLAEQYTQSAEAFEGLIHYLIDTANGEIDVSSLLRDFYRLRGEAKKDFLMSLYEQKLETGDERYKKSLDELGYLDRNDPYKLNWGYVDLRYQ